MCASHDVHLCIKHCLRSGWERVHERIIYVLSVVYVRGGARAMT